MTRLGRSATLAPRKSTLWQTAGPNSAGTSDLLELGCDLAALEHTRVDDLPQARNDVEVLLGTDIDGAGHLSEATTLHRRLRSVLPSDRGAHTVEDDEVCHFEARAI